jgi:hypothetical protein
MLTAKTFARGLVADFSSQVQGGQTYRHRRLAEFAPPRGSVSEQTQTFR